MIPRALIKELGFEQIGPKEGKNAWKTEVWMQMGYNVWVYYEDPEPECRLGYDARKGTQTDFLLWYIKEIEEHHQTEYLESIGEN